MRHISFDESSVLQEFARIAAKKGLVKTAEEPRPMPAAQTPQLISPDLSIPRLTQLPPASPPATKTPHITEAIKALNKTIGEKGPGITDPEKQKLLKDSIDKFKQLYPREAPAFEGAAKQLIQHQTASSETDLTKEGAGAEKLYDVSGETGESLTEKAHPSSAKVEGTDQVVENQVEQQKADLAIINKVPTGKYAELITLADALDEMGLTKYADQIDEVMKKVANESFNINMFEPGQTSATKSQEEQIKEYGIEAGRLIINHLSTVLKPIFALGGLIDKLKSLYGEEYSVVRAKVLNMANDSPYKLQITKALEDAFKLPTVDAFINAPRRLPAAPKEEKDVTIQRPVIGLTPEQLKVQRWQAAFNKRYNLKPGHPEYLKEDGNWGPKTQSAYNKLKQVGPQIPATTMAPTTQINPLSTPFDVAVEIKNRTRVKNLIDLNRLDPDATKAVQSLTTSILGIKDLAEKHRMMDAFVSTLMSKTPLSGPAGVSAPGVSITPRR